ncbi:MAG: ionic transporter y4hA [Betaproteobacteria bacterium]|nr:ionic transporter y4hA [Betaproteobacteria bacterium]
MPAVVGLPLWSIAVPPAGCALLAVFFSAPPAGGGLALVGGALVASVLVAVFHAEVIAHRVGEPFGTLVLALAVTIIEVALIVSLMLAQGPGVDTLARDTVFATVMIVCNGVVGICLLTGAIRHHIVAFRVEGTGSALSVLVALTTLTLVVPEFTTSTSGPTYAPAQLAFAGLSSLLLYGVFVFVQTVRHRDQFLPVGLADDHKPEHAPPAAQAWLSLALLLASLVAVVGLAKVLSPGIQGGLAAIGAPPGVVGIAIALMVLMPETIAALRAAARNRMQISLNLALGSGLATIGLSIPAVALVSHLLDTPLTLGLDPKDIVLLAVTLLVSAITLAGGRATVLQGAVHLVLFAAFLFLAFVP